MEKKTGVVVPLAALYTKDCPAVGDFLALKPFADFCKDCDLSVIQLLPVNDTGTHSSPYSGLSAYALHPLYIRIEAIPEYEAAMQEDKAFASAYKAYKKEFQYSARFDYDQVLAEKNKLLHMLYAYIEKRILSESKKSAAKTKVQVVSANDGLSFGDDFSAQLDRFVRDNPWVIPYAVFKNLKDAAMQASWKTWAENLQNMDRKQIQLRWNNRALRNSHNFFVWCQMRAEEQFKDAAQYVRSKNIVLKGDIPILMNEDSADTWAWPEYFNHRLRAGAPPSGDNPMGQNWGFPTYNWTNLEADDYKWWTDRVKTAAQYYDAFRIDHILGFFRIWAVDEKESTAYLGHTMPYKSISRKTLNDMGFDDMRIRWLSQPHIPTGLIEDITWNHDEAVSMLSKLCDRVGNEELWLFKKEVTGDNFIYESNFSLDGTKDNNVKNALAIKWRDRSLIEVTADNFIPVWSYSSSTSWGTLNDEEKSKLSAVFAQNEEDENKLWKEQATSILQAVTSATRMTACAEDLGCNLKSMPEVLNELHILSLKVIRWNREWEKGGQPFVSFKDYPQMSVSTTSVHDSSTLRQWWNDEKDSVGAYLWRCKEDGIDCSNINVQDPFNPQTAQFCLETAARCESSWFINPMQDYLFLDESLYLDNPVDERINVPGTVNRFNWTYRLPSSVEDLAKNKELKEKIASIAAIHSKKQSH